MRQTHIMMQSRPNINIGAKNIIVETLPALILIWYFIIFMMVMIY